MSSKESRKKKKESETGVVAESYPVLKLPEINPLTDHQRDAFHAFDRNSNLVMAGAAGAGKTFIALYLALKLWEATGGKKRIVILRSVVPTRDMGFLPGTQEEKEAAYLSPYIGVVNEIFQSSAAFSYLVKGGHIKFMTTSFIRGITLNDCTIVVDEFQNCNFHELDSIMTRVGKNSRIIFSGDTNQSDFTSDRERTSVFNFLDIIERLKYFHRVDFTWEDCVRSSLVRDYLMTKDMISHEQKA